MLTYRQLQQEIMADYEKLFALIYEYADTLDPEVKRRRDRMEEIVWSKFHLIRAARRAAKKETSAPPAPQEGAFTLSLSLN
jgi:hypothetical protein